MRRPTVSFIWLLAPAMLAVSSTHAAEPELNRYDLGQRLVQLERAWDAHPDAAARARALPVLKLAVPQMLAGKEVEAAETLDRSRLLLLSAEPTAAERWAASLLVHPSRRLLDTAAKSLAVRISAAYAAGEPPAGTELVLGIIAADGATHYHGVKLIVSKLPLDVEIPIQGIPAGDHLLRAEVSIGGKVLTTYIAGISLVAKPEAQVNLPRNVAEPRNRTELDGKTLSSLTQLLNALARGYSPETNYPAARLAAEAKELLKAVQNGTEFFGPQRPGQFWLTVPTGKNNTQVRIFVPDAAKAGKPLPLVVALHGAGASENMFFDAYGYGLIIRLAKERGWMVVAPRAGWLFDGPPPAAAIVDELAKIYPVDKQRVYLVGHSMGAMQTVKLAQESPGRFAAIAALGGGGTVNKPEVFKDLRVFIGCGSDDFLLGGAKALVKSLEKAGATRVTYKEYPGVEHMLVVQESLSEVFKFFAASKKD